MTSRTLTALAAAICFSGAALAADIPADVAAAVAETTRPADQREADAYRLPAETLAFVGLKPGDKVGELFPSGGYFTRMISDIVGADGRDYALDTTRWKGGVEADQKIAAEPAHKNVVVTGTAFGEFALPEPVDVFWITQNYHDLHINEYGDVDMAAFNKKVFDALKPGGIYFVLDHQANSGTTEADIAKLHRIEKDQVIKEVTAAGFKLIDEGHFLNRASDDHTKPIFDLKGQTDQYALKFQKPS